MSFTVQQGFFTDTDWMTSIGIDQRQQSRTVVPWREVGEVGTDLFSGELQFGSRLNIGPLYNESPVVPTVNWCDNTKWTTSEITKHIIQQQKKRTKLESMAIASALQPESRPTSHQLLCAIFGRICTVHVHKLLFPSFWAKFCHRHKIQQSVWPEGEGGE